MNFSNRPVWEDDRWSPLPLLDRELTTDVCVIGLGGSGLSCITELLDLGKRVVGLDAVSVGGGAAGRNGGFLLAGLPAFYHRAAEALGREAAAAYYRRTIREIEAMALETPNAVRLCGSLRLAIDQEELDNCALQQAAMQADKLPVMPYVGPEGRGLVIPTDGVFNPLLRCRTLARKALTAGAQLYENSRVVEIVSKSRGQLHVRTDSGLVRCAHAVVAVDGRIGALLPGLRYRVRDIRLQMLATAPLEETIWSRPIYMRWGYDYWQQLPDGSIALGGARDRGGLQEETDDPSPSPLVQAELTRTLRDILNVDATITHRWAAIVSYPVGSATHRGLSPTLPICEEVRPNVWALGAYSGTGNVIGAINGRAVARRIAHGPAHEELMIAQEPAAREGPKLTLGR